MAEDIKLSDCPVKGQIDRNATYNGKSWQIRIKCFDENGEVDYKLKKGFLTADEANDAKETYDKEFASEARKHGFATCYAEEMSVKSYLEYYLEEILSSYCAPTTMMVYRYTLYKHILPNWKSDPMLAEVTENELNQLLDVISGTSKTAANKAREYMYLALRYAYYDEKRIHTLPKLKKCPRENKPLNILDKKEIRQLLAVAKDTEWYLEYLLALFLGLRKGEIRGLKFSDFDVDAHTVNIQRQLNHHRKFIDGTCEKVDSVQILTDPKTLHSNRVLHVPDYVWQEVLKRKAVVEANKEKYGDAYIDNHYVSCTEVGNPRGETSINTALTRLCVNNGIKHISVHGLRHCYASILLEQGYELPIISGALGHVSINTTYEMYADIIDGNKEILTYLNELYAMDEEDSLCS